MINLELLPCNNCVYFKGIKQNGKGEKNQFVGCGVLKSGNAEDILRNDGFSVQCDRQKEKYEE